MKTVTFFLISFLLGFGLAIRGAALVGPQDYWIWQKDWPKPMPMVPTVDCIPGKFQSIVVGPDKNIYLGTNGTSIDVWTCKGNTNCFRVAHFGSFADIHGIAVDGFTNVYVLDRTNGTAVVFKFDSTGHLIRSIGGLGTNDYQFGPYGGGSYQGIAVDLSNHLYIADSGNDRIVIYGADGVFLKKWGARGLSPGQFVEPKYIGFLPDGNVIVAATQGGAQIFEPTGRFISRGGVNSPERMGITPDGLLVSPSHSGNRSSFEVRTTTVDDQGGYEQLYGPVPNYVDREGRVPLNRGIAFDPAGTMYYVAAEQTNVAHNGVFITKRQFGRQMPEGQSRSEPALHPSAIPQPVIRSVRQRPDTTLIDIDYAVLDGDSPLVHVGILAFLNGGSNIFSAIPMTRLVEGTLTNVGPEIAANVDHRITWDASEYASNFVSLQFEVLAKDEHGLLQFRFVTIPADKDLPSFEISSFPVQDEDVLDFLLWLLATRDPAVSFDNGVLRGVGGVISGLELAPVGGGPLVNGTTVARALLYQRLGVRSVGEVEKLRAQGGTFGLVAVDSNSVVKQ